MEIPAEVLAAGGGAVTAVVAALWWQVRDRIRALEKSLAKALALIEELRQHDQAERTNLLIAAHDRERRLAAIVSQFGDLQPTDDTPAPASGPYHKAWK